MSKFLWVFISVLFALRAAQAACPHGVKVAAPAHAEAVLYFAPVSVTDSLYTHLPQKTDSAMHAAITIATFSTISTSGKFAANPFISGSIGKFYFENRYNYEAANSASVNIGRQLNTPFAGFAVTPMVGLVAGGFKGLTSEVQAYSNSKHWYLSLDNQYTFNYAATRRSFYYN